MTTDPAAAAEFINLPAHSNLDSLHPYRLGLHEGEVGSRLLLVPVGHVKLPDILLERKYEIDCGSRLSSRSTNGSIGEQLEHIVCPVDCRAGGELNLEDLLAADRANIWMPLYMPSLNLWLKFNGAHELLLKQDPRDADLV